MQATRTPADVLAALSRRYREHYGDRLLGLYAVPEFPFSDEGAEDEDDDVRAVEVVVVLQGSYDHFAETDPVVDIAVDVTEEFDGWMGVFARHAEESDQLAEWARERGVEI